MTAPAAAFAVDGRRQSMLKHVYCHPMDLMLAIGSFCGGLPT